MGLEYLHAVVDGASAMSFHHMLVEASFARWESCVTNGAFVMVFRIQQVLLVGLFVRCPAIAEIAEATRLLMVACSLPMLLQACVSLE